LAVAAWLGELSVDEIIPEGLDDIVLRTNDRITHVEVKSRREARGPFPIRDVARHLTHLGRRLEPGSSTNAALVLEQPPRGVEPGSWCNSVASDPGLVEKLKPYLQDQPDLKVPISELLARTHILVIAQAPQEEMRRIARRLDLPAAACAFHYWALRARIGELADLNGAESEDSQHALGMTEIQQLIDNASAHVDIDALQQAILDGVCETVDFTSPSDDAGFYLGRDVRPGDVVARLVLPRPTLEADVERMLGESGRAVVVGPSGCGKSALLWRVSYESRHSRIWYRVTRLEEGDVPTLIRLARSHLPSSTAQVGFVIDDLGQRQREGWDRLVRDTSGISGLVLLGAAREEDVIQIETAASTYQARPYLDPELAQRLHAELANRGATDWEHWIEPFEKSGGLLLEFGHLLTTGKYLDEVLNAQLEARLRDDRSIELSILRLVCTAHRFGAHVTVEQVAASLERDRDALALPLRRLVDEHLIRSSADNLLRGTHQVRSTAISRLIHKLTPWTLGDTHAQLLGILGPQDLQVFMLRFLREHWDALPSATEELSRRLGAEPNPSLLTSALHALRMASFERQARTWIRASEDAGVSPSRLDVTLNLAVTGFEAPEFFMPEIRDALSRIRQIPSDDARITLLDAVPPTIIESVLASVTRADELLALLAAASDSREWPSESLGDAIARSARQADVDVVATIIEAAHSVSPGAASAGIDALGGEATLARRIEAEVPWLTEVEQSEKATARADVAYVCPSVQTDVHGEVVRLCQLLLWSLQSLEVAKCSAISPAGGLAGYKGVPLANKELPRQAVPSPMQVAWNRTRMRIASNLVSIDRVTTRLLRERELIPTVESHLRDVGNSWCRGQRPGTDIIAGLASAVDEVARLSPFPIPPEDDQGPLAPGAIAENDSFVFLIETLTANLIPRLFDSNANLLALYVMLGKAEQTLEEISAPTRWAAVGDPPSHLRHLAKTLHELRCVLGELHNGGSTFKTTLRARTKRNPQKGLEIGAQVAVDAAQARVGKYTRRVVRELRGANLEAEVFRRTDVASDDWLWPPDDLLVAVHFKSIFDWPMKQDKIVATCQAAFPTQRTINIAPVRDGFIVASQAGRVVRSYFPLADAVAEWQDDKALPHVDEPIGDAFRAALDALTEHAGIVWLRAHWPRPLHEREIDAIRACKARYLENLAILQDACTDSRIQEIVQQAVDLVENVHAVVTEEEQALRDARAVDEYVAPTLWSSLTETPADLWGVIAVIQLALVECDVDPRAATDVVQIGLSELQDLHQ
jgi:alkylated DNA nucleotide flippase Atl1